MAHLKLNMSHTVSTLKKHGVVNIVYMKPNGKVKAVRYDDETLLLNDLAKYDGRCNIYITLNPIKSDLDIEVSNTLLMPIFSILSLKIFIKKKIAILYKLKMAICLQSAITIGYFFMDKNTPFFERVLIV